MCEDYIDTSIVRACLESSKDQAGDITCRKVMDDWSKSRDECAMSINCH